MIRGAAVVVATVLWAASAAGDTLDDVRTRRVLRWGADQEGGGPYVFPRDDDPSLVTGFEVELAEALARRLGVGAELAQGPWDRMPELLRTGKVDVVLNGYEWSAARAAAMAATIPYYVYELRLLVRDDAEIADFGDLGADAKLGVLGGSAAEEWARQHYGDVVEIVPYEGNTDAMREVETGKLAATLQDGPIVAFYGTRFPRLRAVGRPVGRGYYVVYARRGDDRLVYEMNEALVLLLRSGELEALYRRWGLWTPAQKELRRIAEAGRFYGLADAVEAPIESRADDVVTTTHQTSAQPHGLEVARRYGGILLRSAGLTVVLSVISFPLAVGLGLAIALGRLYGPRPLAMILTGYVEFLRGTPVMLQLYFVFFFLPELGIVVPAFWTAILGLAVNYSAYESEIYRAGLQAVPAGQMEAALSLGMSRPLALRRIVVPQAFRMVIPPVVNDFIALFKDTSVCSVVTLVELTKRFSVLSQSTQATIELMILTAALYLAMSLPLSHLAARLESRLAGAPAR